MKPMKFLNTGDSYKTIRYENLAGVDFSVPEYAVDRNRSSWAPNMISDNGKNPVKRTGWQTAVALDGAVHNIWHIKLKGESYILVHAGGKIYSILRGGTEYDPTFTANVLKDGVNDQKGCGFYARKDTESAFYILTGAEYLKFNGETVVDATEDATIPIVSIGRSPTGGGETYQDYNLLTGKRTEQFCGDTTKVYQLSATDIKQIVKVEEINSDGDRVEVDSSAYTANLKTGAVTFTAAHEAPIKGEDNIFITYEKEIEGYKDKILKCTQYAHFGVGGDNRVFLTGNVELPAYDFWSDVFDPTYFGDLDYAIVGNTEQAILGYLKSGNALALIKEDSSSDTSIFLRTGSLNADNDAIFTTVSSNQGIGAVSSNCFAVLNDDPLFLSRRGIYAFCLNNMGTEKVTRNRSFNVDAKLTEESYLKNAVACVWDGYYILSVNGNCYILDGRQKIGAANSESNFRYECYHWDNVYANCFSVEIRETGKDILWFGTTDGAVRFFKYQSYPEFPDTKRPESYTDDDAGIHAEWNTVADDDGCLEMYKTIQRKGCLASFAPAIWSKIKIYFEADGKPIFVKEQSNDVTTLFWIVDFSRLTFDGQKGPREIYFNKKVRKYKRLKIRIVCDEPKEYMGINSIIKTVEIIDYAKK